MGRRLDAHQATNVVTRQPIEAAISTKKKRRRKDKESADVPEGRSTIDTSISTSEIAEHRRKKKKKGHAAEHEVQQGANATGSHDLHVADGDTTMITSALGKKEKKKKKKRKHSEECRVVPPPDAHIDPSLTAMDSGTNTNANVFLSAVVTAAARSASHVHQPPSNFTQHPSSLQVPGFQNLPPGLGGPAISFSGEDLARALQGLDVVKLADALQALGEAGSSTFPLPGQSVSSQATEGTLQNPPPPVSSYDHGSSGSSHGQVPVPSSVIVGQPAQNPARPSVPRNATPVSAPITPREDHAHLLANKWLSATKLNELSRTIGLQYKKGKFSASEEALLKSAIEEYRMRNGLAQDQLNEVIFAKGPKDKDNAFWFDITSRVPLRPVVAVYHHVRRSFHPLKLQGKWMPAEDDALRQAVTDLGQSWEKVSQRVGRMAGDCRDRWRNHINNREGRVYGPWSKEEEDRLTQIVTEMTIAQGKDPDLDVFWTLVAARMGNRGRQQCRIKWTDCLSKTVKNSGQRPRWSQQDAYILVHKIASLNVNDDSEIDWKLLSDENWNLWSAHTLQRRWLTLKRSVRGHEEMTHQEIMDILREKKSHPPPIPAPVKRRVTSAPIVPADAQASDVAIEESFPLAGSSGFGSLPGTAFPGASVDAVQPLQPQFTHFVEDIPQVASEQSIVTENAGAGPSNVQHSDNDSSSSSSSDSDASDSE